MFEGLAGGGGGSLYGVGAHQTVDNLERGEEGNHRSKPHLRFQLVESQLTIRDGMPSTTM